MLGLAWSYDAARRQRLPRAFRVGLSSYAGSARDRPREPVALPRRVVKERLSERRAAAAAGGRAPPEHTVNSIREGADGKGASQVQRLTGL